MRNMTDIRQRLSDLVKLRQQVLDKGAEVSKKGFAQLEQRGHDVCGKTFDQIRKFIARPPAKPK